MKRFSYSTRNTVKNKWAVLDVVFDKKYNNEVYVYVLEKNDIIPWEATGCNPNTKIKFE